MMCWCRTLVVCTVGCSPTHRARRKNRTYDGNWKKTAWIQPLQKFRFSYHCFVFHIFGASWEQRNVLSVSLSLWWKKLCSLKIGKRVASLMFMTDSHEGWKCFCESFAESESTKRNDYMVQFSGKALFKPVYTCIKQRQHSNVFAFMSVSSLFLLWMLATNYTRTLNLFKVLLRCLSCLIVPLRLKMIANHKNNTTHTYHYTPKTIDFLRNMKIRWWLTTCKWSSSWQSKSFFHHDSKIKQNFEITRSVCYFEFDQALSDEEEWRSWWFMQTQISSSQKRKKKTNTNSDDDFQAVR